MEHLVEKLNAVTGRVSTFQVAIDVGLRNVQHLRIFDIKSGFITEMKTPSAREHIFVT